MLRRLLNRLTMNGKESPERERIKRFIAMCAAQGYVTRFRAGIVETKK